MITLYSGTPGSGKSYHMAKQLYHYAQKGVNLILNFDIKHELLPKNGSIVCCWTNQTLTTARLEAFSRAYHTPRKEGQTILVIDEAQLKFNCRSFQQQDRYDWISFFSQHRKLGFDVFIIAQNDRMIDRQIRSLVEIEVKHRKVSRYGVIGVLLSLLTGRSVWCCAIEYWYGGNGDKLDSRLFRVSNRVGRIYDTFDLFGPSSEGECNLEDFGAIKLDGSRGGLSGLRVLRSNPPLTAQRDATDTHRGAAGSGGVSGDSAQGAGMGDGGQETVPPSGYEV